MKINSFTRARGLTTAELDALHAHLPVPHAVVASVLRRTGCVTPSSVILIAPTVKGKTKTRAVPFHPLLAEELDAWKLVANPDNNPEQWVFPGRHAGAHLTRRGFDHQLRKAVKELGLTGTSTHACRRSFLTSCSQNGVPLRNIQAISGHSNHQVLANYIEVSDSDKSACLLAGA